MRTRNPASVGRQIEPPVRGSRPRESVEPPPVVIDPRELAEARAFARRVDERAAFRDRKGQVSWPDRRRP